MQGCELVNFLLVLSFFNSQQQKPKKREIVKFGFLNFWVPSTAKRRTLQHQQFHVITFMWLLYMTSNYRSWLWRLHMATKIRSVWCSAEARNWTVRWVRCGRRTDMREQIFSLTIGRGRNSCVGCVRTMQARTPWSNYFQKWYEVTSFGYCQGSLRHNKSTCHCMTSIPSFPNLHFDCRAWEGGRIISNPGLHRCETGRFQKVFDLNSAIVVKTNYPKCNVQPRLKSGPLSPLPADAKKQVTCENESSLKSFQAVTHARLLHPTPRCTPPHPTPTKKRTKRTFCFQRVGICIYIYK